VPKLVDHEERRRQIAEALLEIASTRGLHAATMREVAAQAGVSLRLVQYYFNTKDELLVGALSHLSERLSARIRERTELLDDPERSPRAVIYGALSAILPIDEDGRRIVLTYHAYYTFALSEQQPVMERGALDAAELEQFLTDQLRRAQQAGEISAEHNPGQAATVLLALTNGLGLSVLTGQRDGNAALATLAYHVGWLFNAP
jgi:AcrR family transcriptional regulator